MQSQNKKLFAKKQRGFSIMEVMGSSFVLTIGLVAVTALVAKSLGQSLENQNTIIAVELAQEGIELVRNVRDNDFAAGGNGFAAFSNSKHCRRDYNDSVSSWDCQSAQGVPSRYFLQYAGGFYAHFSAAPSRFSRYIYIDYKNGPKTALVRSFVYWGGFRPPSSGNSAGCSIANKCVFTEVNLTSWK